MNLSDYKRIIIIGSPGSGKSTLAALLGKLTNLPIIHLDIEFWKPNWVETPLDEWEEKQKQLIANKEWIIDGNYSATLEMRYMAADLVIFLDVGRLTCIWSAIKRRGKKRYALPDYLDEPKLFSKDFLKFLKFIWNYPKKNRQNIFDLHQRYPCKAFLHIKGRKMLNRYSNRQWIDL